mmetsp:Transcript_112261/g.194950  ORF Transcript_112261/g.194950 Transcript_112261/m.194950 type:complete len:88 (+) Transcript_112261:1791-2054(+)
MSKEKSNRVPLHPGVSLERGDMFISSHRNTAVFIKATLVGCCSLANLLCALGITFSVTYLYKVALQFDAHQSKAKNDEAVHHEKSVV